MNVFNEPIAGESWKTFFAVVLGSWLLVWLCAALHDQYLIRIAPEHFTVWHYRMPYFTSHTMLGIAYAFAATFSPGLFLGMGLFVAGRLFSRPKLSVRQILLGIPIGWCGVEVCSLLAGGWVWWQGKPLYPDWIYPTNEFALVMTQTIQVTTYLSGTILSVVLLGVTWMRRSQKVFSRTSRVPMSMGS